VESVLHFVGDQLYLIAVAVFAVASFGIISWSGRGQLRSSGRTGLAGVRTAAIASAVPVVILVLLLLIIVVPLNGLIGGLVGSGYTASTSRPVDPAGLARDAIVGLLWLVSIPGVTFLAVLDLYAVRPPRPEDQAGAAKSYAVLGTLCSLLLMGGALLAPVLIEAAAASAALRDKEAAFDQLQREIDARSAGLTMEITVVDANFGAPTQNGRVVEHLTLDVRVRSATEIDLRQGEDGIGRQSLWLMSQGPRADGTTSGTNAVVDADLQEMPTHIPAGFDATYRLEVPVAPEERQPPNPAATGTWTAFLSLQDRSPGPARETSIGWLELSYETTARFTVTDAP
jgi:hypothetical protein